MSILDEYNHGSNGYHGYNSVIRHSEHPSHPCQHRVSGSARSPLRAASRPERLARECEPYQMASAGRRRLVRRTKQNSLRTISNSTI